MGETKLTLSGRISENCVFMIEEILDDENSTRLLVQIPSAVIQHIVDHEQDDSFSDSTLHMCFPQRFLSIPTLMCWFHLKLEN